MIKTIGVLVFDDFNLLDISGPIEVFETATQLSTFEYEIIIIGEKRQIYKTESGIKILAEASIADKYHFDTIIVPGGGGARTSGVSAMCSSWLKSQLTDCRRVVSICTGAVFGAFEKSIYIESLFCQPNSVDTTKSQPAYNGRNVGRAGKYVAKKLLSKVYATIKGNPR